MILSTRISLCLTLALGPWAEAKGPGGGGGGGGGSSEPEPVPGVVNYLYTYGAPSVTNPHIANPDNKCSKSKPKG